MKQGKLAPTRGVHPPKGLQPPGEGKRVVDAALRRYGKQGPK